MSKDDYICQQILLTNDDGIDAAGLHTLSKIAERLAPEIWIVAPAFEKSGASQCVSLHKTVKFNRRSEQIYAVDGTPADCVAIACGHLMKRARPDLILSGVNNGPNLGTESVFSGTVGAAMTGLLFDIPSVALSLARKKEHQAPLHWETPLEIAPELIRKLFISGWRQDTCLNINFPDIPSHEIRDTVITQQGQGRFNGFSVVNETFNDNNGSCEIVLRHKDLLTEDNTDSSAIADKNVAITPLHFNRTSNLSLDNLSHLKFIS
ncbi:5'/3'-nucleotidase SurE [Klebsiella oxytoca]|uniref:5'/3'-nucleotidase SurE n=1 Tax=Klebsiella oxytoca TaxID=571 RepID=UPI0035714A28